MNRYLLLALVVIAIRIFLWFFRPYMMKEAFANGQGAYELVTNGTRV